MRCLRCGLENPEGMSFCEACGSKLARVCPSCGQEVTPTANFCGKCGVLLAAPATKRQQAKTTSTRTKRAARTAKQGTAQSRELNTPRTRRRAAREGAEAERRQLTVQFIDLVGSTTLSQQLDPEDYHARVVAYQTACHQIIQRYDGHIAQYLGDGVLVYFGYPLAHEEDAARAVRSSLEIVAAVGQLKYTPPLQVRIGIHTGPVVVGEIGVGVRTERLALGGTPNIAARVQGKAEPDSVVLSTATFRLVQGLFECQDLGPQALKGIATPLSLYHVMGESAAQSRFEAAVGAGLTPLVGRAEELELLQRRWALAKGGAGQIVLLSGEPGIGKSRLVQELKEQLEHEEATRIEFRCSPYHQNSAFHPIIDHLQRLLQFAREDTPAIKLEKLQHTLRHYRFPRAETLSLLAALLSLPHPEGAPAITLGPQKQKQKTQEALVAWLVEEAEQRSVYTVWEDLHWADPSTLEVLTLVVDQVPTTRLLVLLTSRPEFTSPWGTRSYLTQLTLNRLGRPLVEAMVERVAGGKALPSEVVQHIVAKTDGVPLFVEELTKTVVESGLLITVQDRYELRGPLPPLAIPSTLQDSLMARLDRLAPVKEVAQVGAVLGREFSYELLHAVCSIDEATLQHGLKQLVEAELVYQHGLPPQATYLFKHALIQDTAYHSLLKSTRQHYHRQIAQVLEEQFTEIQETQPELLAHHYTEAGLIAQAIPYWQRAGENAVRRSAHQEAISLLTKGLELLKASPDLPERLQHELALQTLLGSVFQITKDQAAPETGVAFRRAYELCRHLEDTPQLFPTLAGLRRFYAGRGESHTARELAQQMLTIAQRVHDPALLVEAHHALGNGLFWLGEFVAAQAQVEQGIALHDPQQHRSLAFVHGIDPGVQCRNFAAHALWVLGYPEQALQRSPEALTLARELAHLPSQAIALNFASIFHQLRREEQLSQERAEAVIALSIEHGFALFLAFGTVLRGWALTEQGQREEGIAQMHQGLIAMQASGRELGLPHCLALLAEAHGKVGQAEEGLTVLAEALALVDKNGECYYEAELYRLKGELTLQRFNVQGSKFKVEDSLKSSVQSLESEAEEYFLKAIEIARKQQAKSWELRASTSLARLWQQQGKKDEARQMLAEIYGWFTEGFDTKDLQEAKALLEELI